MVRMLAFTLRTHGRFLSRGGTVSDLYLNIFSHVRLLSGEWAASSKGGSRPMRRVLQQSWPEMKEPDWAGVGRG